MSTDEAPPSHAPLHALRNAGTIGGVCLAKNSEIIENLFPFSEQRLLDLLAIIDDVMAYFVQEGRAVDQMAFGYDGGNIVIVTDEDYRLIVLHVLVDEIDFIAKASRAFLIDYQMDLYAQALRPVTAKQPLRSISKNLSDDEDEVETEPMTADVSTGPIKPRVSVTQSDAPLPAAAASAAAENTESPEEVPMPEPPAPQSTTPADTSTEKSESESSEAPVFVATAEATSDRNAIASSGAVVFDEDQQRNSHLAPDQPENTLPPPRKARSRG